MTEFVYQTAATATGGRGGKVASEDGRLSLALSLPRELGGDSGQGTNPEQLFAAGYAACFHSALSARARARGLTNPDVTVHVATGLMRREPTGFRLGVTLTVEMPGVDPDQARELVAEADDICPYSDALRGNAVVSVSLAG
ncbi:organic hydroperoxide resistance protein [Actinophytocola sp.]|uniref:organic hydroperoxide resistance protein n=1 Tax=Actinophytocola sp. TaxID=1872138 RepID=UPI003D6AAC83